MVVSAAEVLTFASGSWWHRCCALDERRRSRDLFDLWVALDVLEVDPSEVLACFATYRPESYTHRRARQRLRAHMSDEAFRSELEGLLLQAFGSVDAAAVASRIERELLVAD
ncbi:MAG: nucleotidyl transferase AbiEii/AbiGii toxin family protein [Microthrixaceae bacterium]